MSNEYYHETVWSSLPEAGDKTQIGKTPKQIAIETGLENKQVSQSLQILKARKKARSYQGKWRQTPSLSDRQEVKDYSVPFTVDQWFEWRYGPPKQD